MTQHKFTSIVHLLMFIGYATYGLGVFFLLMKWGKPGIVTLFAGMCVHILASGVQWFVGAFFFRQHETKDVDGRLVNINNRDPVTS